MHRLKKNSIVSVIIIIAVNIFLTETLRTNGKSAGQKNKAPDFNLFDINGKVHRLSRIIKERFDSKGNIVVLNFFGTWCPPCKKELPHFVKFSKDYKEKGVKFIGILLEKKYEEEKVKKFVKDNKIDYPVLIGTTGVVKDYGGVKSMPTTFIINEKGSIVKKQSGYMDKKSLEKIIKKLIQLRKKGVGKK